MRSGRNGACSRDGDMKTSGTFRGSGSQGALGSVETGLFSGGIPFDFVAQERECEGARPVDNLSPVGAALFEQGYGTVRAGYGHPDRADAVSYTHLTLPTTAYECRSRWSPYH